VIRERRARTERWISSSIQESQWTTELARYSSADYHVNNLVSPVLFQEALEHVPDNAIVIEIAPHSLLQAVLRRALPNTCTIVGLMDKRQPDNLVHILTALGKYVSTTDVITVPPTTSLFLYELMSVCHCVLGLYVAIWIAFVPYLKRIFEGGTLFDLQVVARLMWLTELKYIQIMLMMSVIESTRNLSQCSQYMRKPIAVPVRKLP